MKISIRKLVALTKFKFIEIIKNKTNLINIGLLIGLVVVFNVVYGKLVPDGDEKAKLLMMAMVLNMGILYVLTLNAIMIPASSLARDKEKNTLRTLMTSSVTAFEYFFSSIIPVLIISILLNIAVLFISGFPIAKINIVIFLLYTTVGTLISTIIGMIIGIYSKNQMASSTISSPVMMILLMLPILSKMSDGLEKASNFTYTGVIYKMIDSYATTGTYSASLSNILVLVITFIVCIIAFMYAYKINGYEND